MLRPTNYLTKLYDDPQGFTLAAYERSGGYQQAPRALSMPREALVEEMKAANIRGRGGAGFPMGVKWSFMPWPPKPEKPHYLVINADEGEPGTFKDRTIMEKNPHSVVEGCIIGCFGIGAHTAYVYVRDELHLSKDRLWAAIEEARAKGYLGARPFGIDYPVDVIVHTGAGAYICGEETGLLNSLEGKRGEPRLKPPFPAQAGRVRDAQHGEQPGDHRHRPHRAGHGRRGLLQAQRPAPPQGRRHPALRRERARQHARHRRGLRGRDAPRSGLRGRRRRQRGRPDGDHPRGIVVPHPPRRRAGRGPQREEPLHAWHGKSVLDVPLGVDTFRALGTMLGTCCAIVLSDKADPLLAFHNLMRFYRHESCGQCTPCREGSAWLDRILGRMVKNEATVADLDRLSEIADNIMGNTICAFGEGTAMPALGFLLKFRKEMEERIKTRGKSATGKLAIGAWS